MSVRAALAIAALTAVAVACLPAGARRLKTTRTPLRAEKVQPAKEVPDTLASPETCVSFTGYEKVQSSSKECFFVTNISDTTVKELCLSIEYFDSQRRMLHRRTETFSLDLEPGETQMMQIKSWDPQHVWHYRNTQGRHNDYSLPFDVTFHIEYVTY